MEGMPCIQPITKVCVVGFFGLQHLFEAQIVTANIITAPTTVTVISTAEKYKFKYMKK